ncbi:hypothetical protein BJ878DRAFT_72526 [Calycina marina]|uniref:Carboxylic ester hydrolase n=1 Tax=Calycina marina TaxID=1763456 RepID=A0A9P8CGG1_9HELO|nr:hypothetical protein BJ878DRAFT_72526 [Calycina marina]
MMDQLLAMEWVQSYISLFGGDKDRVTVAGCSAGAGCLVNRLISRRLRIGSFHSG